MHEHTKTEQIEERQSEQERYNEIPKPIRDLGLNNSLIAHMCTQYALRCIITKEEFYCQCIAGLANNWSQQNEQYIKLIQMTSTPHIT